MGPNSAPLERDGGVDCSVDGRPQDSKHLACIVVNIIGHRLWGSVFAGVAEAYPMANACPNQVFYFL